MLLRTAFLTRFLMLSPPFPEAFLDALYLYLHG